VDAPEWELTMPNLQDGQKVQVTLVRSPIRYSQRQKDTLKGLGLRRMHNRVEMVLNPTLRGMISAIQHLVTVEILEADNKASS
jgi:large subunit ribosomal protein L30